MIPDFLNRGAILHKPGIYIYKDENGEVLYVGKAIDLKSRVSSYFNSRSQSPKTAALVERISAIETIVVESELEALILEANLIKKFLPPFNIRLTDDKDYLYIAVTKEDFPRVITARKKDLKPIKSWYGPFPSASTVKSTLKQLRRVFPWCQSPPKKISNIKYKISKLNHNRPCFYFHLGLCPGPCVGKISREDYLKIIKSFEKFMSGAKQELLDELNEEMSQKAAELNFEQAQSIKKIMLGVEYLTAPNRVSKYLEDPNFLEDERHRSLLELQRVLKLKELPERIEAYDISNFGGKEATGSLVVLTNGEIDKSQYRKFKIRISGKPNDYAMHAEMMSRRLNHPEWPLPQLILIDGGRGQVRAVWKVIQSINNRTDPSTQTAQDDSKSIPIFGLAKRMEWLYPPEGEVIKLPKRSLALRLLQRIRDESHRFAVAYHKKLRSQKFGI